MNAPTDALAQQLYGATTGAPVAPDGPASFLGGRNAAEKPSSAKAQAHRQMYEFSERQGHEDFIKRLEPRYNLYNPEQLRALVDGVSPVLSRMELQPNHHEQIHRAIAQSMGADAAQREAWRKEAVDRLQANYGPRWRDALSLAKRWAARDPEFSKWLNDSSSGDHPDFVEVIADRAWQARLRGDFE